MGWGGASFTFASCTSKTGDTWLWKSVFCDVKKGAGASTARSATTRAPGRCFCFRFLFHPASDVFPRKSRPSNKKEKQRKPPSQNQNQCQSVRLLSAQQVAQRRCACLAAHREPQTAALQQPRPQITAAAPRLHLMSH